jgi:hypothetical protein
MTNNRRIAAGSATLVAIIVLAVVGQRVSPAVMATGANASKNRCDVDAPPALHNAGKRWCADGLFVRAAITGDDKDVIAVMQFTPNGAQTWELQSGLLMGEFANLTNQVAADAPGKNISIDLHDAADRRVGACARKTTDKAAKCGTK